MEHLQGRERRNKHMPGLKRNEAPMSVSDERRSFESGFTFQGSV